MRDAAEKLMTHMKERLGATACAELAAEISHAFDSFQVDRKIRGVQSYTRDTPSDSDSNWKLDYYNYPVFAFQMLLSERIAGKATIISEDHSSAVKRAEGILNTVGMDGFVGHYLNVRDRGIEVIDSRQVG